MRAVHMLELTMAWLLTNLISKFLLPPLMLLIMGVSGLLLGRKRADLGRALTGVSLLLIWLTSTPYVAEAAMHWLEGAPVTLDIAQQPAEAIVVLGGGQYFSAPEFGGENTVSTSGLERVRYAARLHRKSGVPILVTGGSPEGDYVSEAVRMKETLEQDFNVQVRWIESESNNTRENAYFSHAILQREGIKRVYLVTHAWHMPRSTEIFRKAGFEVIPAPMGYKTRFETNLLTFLPEGHAMEVSSVVAHEVVGMLWYRLKSAL